jgi:hypothetical protein
MQRCTICTTKTILLIYGAGRLAQDVHTVLCSGPGTHDEDEDTPEYQSSCA